MIHYLTQITNLKMSSHHLYTQIIKAIEYKRKCLKIDGKAPPSIFNTWNEFINDTKYKKYFNTNNDI